MCEKRGAELTERDELMWRHVLPAWLVDDGTPSTQAFHPWREVDECCLSLDRSTLKTEERSFEDFNTSRQKRDLSEAVGVWALTVGEFNDASVKVWSDPEPGSPLVDPNDAHVVADFAGHSASKQKSIARALKLKATKRGRVHPK